MMKRLRDQRGGSKGQREAPLWAGGALCTALDPAWWRVRNSTRNTRPPVGAEHRDGKVGKSADCRLPKTIPAMIPAQEAFMFCLHTPLALSGHS